MKAALIFIRVIVAVSMISASIFFAQSVEAFHKYDHPFLLAEGQLFMGGDERGRRATTTELDIARKLLYTLQEAIQEGESSCLVASGVFCEISLLSILAGNRLKAALRAAATSSSITDSAVP